MEFIAVLLCLTALIVVILVIAAFDQASEIKYLKTAWADFLERETSRRLYVITISKYSKSQAEKESIAAQFSGRVAWLEYDQDREPRPEVEVIE